VFVHKMNAIRIKDLATAMIESLAPEYGHNPTDIDIEETGRRVAETYHEEIITEREVARTVENDSLYAVCPETTGDGAYLDHDGIEGFEQVDDVVRSSEHAEKLDKDEIVALIQRGVKEETNDV
jgi:UDP-N-acetylglucosamine 4,6-dehydratase